MREFARCTALALLLAATTPSPSRAAPVDHAREYRACLALVPRDPVQAFEAAGAWAKQGGGAPAEHCAALALVERGHFDIAAERLEGIAATLGRDSRISPGELLAQAANVWLLAGNLERAAKMIAIAVALAPDDAPILVDPARIQAEAGEYALALATLDSALLLAPLDGDAYAYRAGALRRLGRAAEARRAAEKAVALDPLNPSARLERGLAALALGDREGARLELEETARRFDGTPAAAAARASLAALAKAGPAPLPPATAVPPPPIPGVKPPPPGR